MKNFKNGFMTTMGVLAGLVVFSAIGTYLKDHDEAKKPEESKTEEETVTE